MMEHIQQGFEGTSIQRWELEHGIGRVVRGGCEYVICTDFQRFQQQMEDERRQRLRAYIADRQAEAYLGG